MAVVFSQALKVGQMGESLIASWLRSRCWHVLPVYETEINTGKGPRLFAATCELIVPDMFVFNGARARWVEAKHKTAFTWYRKKQVWQTGIDRHHFHQYRRVAAIGAWPVWLMFLHRGGQAKDSPPNSPSGLFAGEIEYLASCIDHEDDSASRTGMVYWNYDALKCLASLDEVYGLRLAV